MVKEERFIKFIEQWMNALALLAKYPLSNRLVTKNVSVLYELLPSVIDTDHLLTFSEIHNSLLINDRLLFPQGQNAVTVSAFLFMMLRQNLLKLQIHRDISRSDFGKLLARLASMKPMGANPSFASTKLAFGEHIRIELQTMVEDAEMHQSRSGPRRPLQESPEEETLLELVMPEETSEVASLPNPRGDEQVVTIIVSVGQMALHGAEIRLVGNGAPDESQTTAGDVGATFCLSPGEHEVHITYDQYKITTTITVQDSEMESQVIPIDLQKLFK